MCSKCSKLYTGETCKEYRKRLYEHRASVIMTENNRPTPVSRKFSTDTHTCTPYRIFSSGVVHSEKFEPSGKRGIQKLSLIFRLHTPSTTRHQPTCLSCGQILLHLGYHPYLRLHCMNYTMLQCIKTMRF